MSEYAFRVSHVQSPQKSGSASLPRAMKSGNSDEMENSATMCGKQKEPESDCTELRALLLFLLLWQAMFKVAKTLYNFDECVCQRPNGEVVSAKCSHVSYPRHPNQARKEAMWFPSNENYEVKSRKDILVS